MYIINFRYKESIDTTVHSIVTSSVRFYNDMKKDDDLEILELKVIKES